MCGQHQTSPALGGRYFSGASCSPRKTGAQPYTAFPWSSCVNLVSPGVAAAANWGYVVNYAVARNLIRAGERVGAAALEDRGVDQPHHHLARLLRCERRGQEELR